MVMDITPDGGARAALLLLRRKRLRGGRHPVALEQTPGARGYPAAPQPYSVTVAPEPNRNEIYMTHLRPASAPAQSVNNLQNFLVTFYQPDLDAARAAYPTQGPYVPPDSAFSPIGRGASNSIIVNRQLPLRLGPGQVRHHRPGRAAAGGGPGQQAGRLSRSCSWSGPRSTPARSSCGRDGAARSTWRWTTRRRSWSWTSAAACPGDLPPTFTLVRAVPLPAGPQRRPAPHPPGGRAPLVAVSCSIDGSLAFYDDDLGQIAALIPGVGAVPFAISHRPARTTGPALYVSNFGDGRIAVVDVPLDGDARPAAGSLPDSWPTSGRSSTACSPPTTATAWTPLREDAPPRPGLAVALAACSQSRRRPADADERHQLLGGLRLAALRHQHRGATSSACSTSSPARAFSATSSAPRTRSRPCPSPPSRRRWSCRTPTRYGPYGQPLQGDWVFARGAGSAAVSVVGALNCPQQLREFGRIAPRPDSVVTALASRLTVDDLQAQLYFATFDGTDTTLWELLLPNLPRDRGTTVVDSRRCGLYPAALPPYVLQPLDVIRRRGGHRDGGPAHGPAPRPGARPGGAAAGPRHPVDAPAGALRPPGHDGAGPDPGGDPPSPPACSDSFEAVFNSDTTVAESFPVKRLLTHGNVVKVVAYQDAGVISTVYLDTDGGIDGGITDVVMDAGTRIFGILDEASCAGTIDCVGVLAVDLDRTGQLPLVDGGTVIRFPVAIDGFDDRRDQYDDGGTVVCVDGGVPFRFADTYYRPPNDFDGGVPRDANRMVPIRFSNSGSVGIIQDIVLQSSALVLYLDGFQRQYGLVGFVTLTGFGNSIPAAQIFAFDAMTLRQINFAGIDPASATTGPSSTTGRRRSFRGGPQRTNPDRAGHLALQRERVRALRGRGRRHRPASRSTPGWAIHARGSGPSPSTAGSSPSVATSSRGTSWCRWTTRGRSASSPSRCFRPDPTAACWCPGRAGCSSSLADLPWPRPSTAGSPSSRRRIRGRRQHPGAGRWHRPDHRQLPAPRLLQPPEQQPRRAPPHRERNRRRVAGAHGAPSTGGTSFFAVGATTTPQFVRFWRPDADAGTSAAGLPGAGLSFASNPRHHHLPGRGRRRRYRAHPHAG